MFQCSILFKEIKKPGVDIAVGGLTLRCQRPRENQKGKKKFANILIERAFVRPLFGCKIH